MGEDLQLALDGAPGGTGAGEESAFEGLLDALGEALAADLVAVVHRPALPSAPLLATVRAPKRRQTLPLPEGGAREDLLSWLASPSAALAVADLAKVETPAAAWLAGQGLRSAILAPVPLDGEVVGAVAAFARARDAFAASDVSRIEPFARAAGALVRGAWRAEAIESQLEIGQVTWSSGNIKELLREACRLAPRLCGADRSSIWFWDEERRRYVPVFSEYASGEQRPVLVERFRRLEISERQRVIMELFAEARTPVCIDDAQASPLFTPEVAQAFGYRSVMGVPLVHDDRRVGALTLDIGEVRPFTPRQVKLAAAIGQQLAPVVAQWRRLQQTETQLRQAEAQLQIAQALSSTLELKPLLGEIARQAARACGMDRCSVWMYRGKHLVPVMSQFADGHGDPSLWQRFKATTTHSRASVPLVEEAIRTRAPVVIENPAEDPRVPDHIRAFEAKYLVVLPLLRPGQPAGVLMLSKLTEGQAARPEQISFGMTIASQMALAVENAVLYEASQRQARELQVLGELRKALSSTLDLASVLDAVADSVQRLTGAHRCSVFELDDHDGRLHPRATRGQAVADLVPLRLGEGVVGRAAAEKRVVVNAAEEAPAGGAILAVPMVSKAALLGAIAIEWNEARESEAGEIALVEALAESAAIAVENARLFQEAQLRLGQSTDLLDMANVLASTTGLQPLLKEIAQRAARAVGVERCSIFLLQDDSQPRPTMAQYADGHADAALWDRFRTVAEHHLLGEIGALAEALRSAQPVVIDDAASSDLIPAWWMEMFAIKNMLVVPLIRKNAVIGALHLDNTVAKRPIRGAQITLAMTIASQVALGIDNVRLYEETQARLRQAEVQVEIARTLDSTLDLQAALTRIARRAARACDMDRCSIWLWEDDRVVPVTSQYGDGRGDPRLWEAFVGLGELRVEDVPFFTEMMRSRGPVVIADAEHDPRIPRSMELFRLTAVLSVPLIRQERIIGAISLDNSERRRRVTPAQIAMATTLASQIALAIDNVRLFEETQGQRARLGEILESTSDGIVFVRQDGVVESANRRARELLRGADFVGRAVRDIVPGVDEGRGEGDLVLTNPPRVLRWASRPAHDATGEVVGLTLTLRDVTEEREVSQMKSDFVSFVTHQLRTPLSGIRWMLELAQEEPVLAPEVAAYVGDAKAASERLITLVNELLDIARLEQGKLVVHPEPVDLAALTREVVDGMGVLVEEKGHTLSVAVDDDLPPVIADPQLLRQVVLNLTSNAIKYTPGGGMVDIALRRDGREVRWVIRDNGIGIPRESQRRLFEKFYRADNIASLETEGTGLGLYLVRLILEQFRGRVWCESEEGKGSTFSVVLPGGERA